MGRFVEGLSAVVCFAALLVVPVALVRFGGWPPPHQLPDPSTAYGPAATHPVIIAAGFAAGWLAWAALVVAVAIRTVTVVCRAVAALPRLRLPGPLQTLSATIAGTVAVTTTVTAAAASAAPPRAAATATVPTGHPTLRPVVWPPLPLALVGCR